MVKMHKLTKGGQTIFPATTTDAVVNPKTRKNMTTELSEFEEIIQSQNLYPKLRLNRGYYINVNNEKTLIGRLRLITLLK